jgi:hypothetical protein
MSIRLILITKDPKVAKIAQNASVDWIMVDMEYIGKSERQKNRNTVISRHTIEDVKNIRAIINQSKLVVRINPIGQWSKNEIQEVISAGADIIMLPYFKDSQEVQYFVDTVNGNIKTCLLVETVEAVNNIDNILKVDGIDYIHIGLNDLNIQRKTTFMFEFLSDGSLDKLANHIKSKKIPFGFGGMARIGKLKPPAECILAEHYRLESDGVILAREFFDVSKFDNYYDIENSIMTGVVEIRNYENIIKNMPEEYFEQNRLRVIKDINEVVQNMKDKL